MTIKEAINIVEEEIDYRNKIWNKETTSSEGVHSPEEWLMYIEDYIDEAKHLLTRENVQTSYPKAMSIMRKVAAMSIIAITQNETPRR